MRLSLAGWREERSAREANRLTVKMIVLWPSRYLSMPLPLPPLCLSVFLSLSSSVSICACSRLFMFLPLPPSMTVCNFVCLSVYFVCFSVCIFGCPFVTGFFCLSVSPSVGLLVCLSVCLNLSVYVFIYIFVCLLGGLFICSYDCFRHCTSTISFTSSIPLVPCVKWGLSLSKSLPLYHGMHNPRPSVRIPPERIK